MLNSRLIGFKNELNAAFNAKFTKTSYFNAFSIELHRKKRQKHRSRSPDMFPKVAEPENAYLASSHHPNDMMQKWRMLIFVDIKVSR